MKRAILPVVMINTSKNGKVCKAKCVGMEGDGVCRYYGYLEDFKPDKYRRDMICHWDEDVHKNMTSL